MLRRLAPIEIASARFDEFVEGRRQFSRDEWVDVLLRTMGYEPTNPDFSPRRRWLSHVRLDGDVETVARTSHLFLPLPDTVCNDMAFHDRWHAYLPGWELPKMQTTYFTSHHGFIADYIAEVFPNELRPRGYADVYDRYFHLGSHVEERDRKAVARTTSGLIKLLQSDGEVAKAEVEEHLRFAIELRRRVKEQLSRTGAVEYARVNLSHIDKNSPQESFVSCKELGSTQLIPDSPLPPGDVFTVGYDPPEGRYILFRI